MNLIFLENKKVGMLILRIFTVFLDIKEYYISYGYLYLNSKYLY
jgi:hypothetical protein